ncbi:MAG: hypothetical protein ACQEQF_00745 [Bacillota bacterium]
MANNLKSNVHDEFSKVGKFVENVRIKKGLTINEFCKKLGLATTSYYEKRKGRQKFTDEQKKQIKKIGKLSYKEFYEGFFK